jgi:Phage integrase family
MGGLPSGSYSYRAAKVPRGGQAPGAVRWAELSSVSSESEGGDARFCSTNYLKEFLERAQRRSPLILTNTRGLPWTSDGFRTSWAKLCAKAKIADLTFHDLRGSAVIRLALAGATVPEIATFTGHSLKDVESILDAHYLGRDMQLAENAMRKLELREAKNRTDSGK